MHSAYCDFMIFSNTFGRSVSANDKKSTHFQEDIAAAQVITIPTHNDCNAMFSMSGPRQILPTMLWSLLLITRLFSSNLLTGK